MTKRTKDKHRFKGDWRYIPVPEYRLDSMLSYNPEDEWIDRIDNGVVEDNTISLTSWLYENIEDDRISNIIFRYMWLGDSMEEIGMDMELTRVRIWQLYKKGLGIMKDKLTAEEYKDLFIGE